MVRAVFIGKNGSMRFTTGRTYNLDVDLSVSGRGDPFISIATLSDGKHYTKCPYGSVEAFLRNWRVISVK